MKTPTRRRALLAVTAMAAVLATGAAAAQGGYPTRPVTLVVAYPAGGDTDVLARLFAEKLTARGASFISAPVSGNGPTVKAGKLSCVASGPKAAYDEVRPMLATFAPRGVAYVGEGELARICKIAHNVMLGVVIQNLAEITVLTNKAGVPRHAFLEFMNNGVMGSIFTRYKTNALVNLDWTTTFTPELLRKDLDLGLAAARDLGVPMPVTAATREALQSHFGAATLKDDPAAYLQMDFAAILETVALGAGMTLKSEGRPVPTGLEVLAEAAE